MTELDHVARRLGSPVPVHELIQACVELIVRLSSLGAVAQAVDDVRLLQPQVPAARSLIGSQRCLPELPLICRITGQRAIRRVVDIQSRTGAEEGGQRSRANSGVSR